MPPYKQIIKLIYCVI